MTNEDYETTVHQLMLLARLVRGMDLDGVLDRISEAESTGAILDPTLYRKAMPKMDLIRRIAFNAKIFQNGLPTLAECLEAEEHQAAWERVEKR
jgi:hypothetical protein